MKKIILLLPALVIMAGCYRDDIDELKNDINQLKEQMAQHETLLDALNRRLTVTGYQTTGSYHIITLSDGTKLSVRNTAALIETGHNGNLFIDGADTGIPTPDGTPAIAIGANGNWYIDGDDTGTPARAQAGADASQIISIALIDGQMTFLFAVSNGSSTISFEDNTTECSFDNFMVTNSTYAVLSMMNGDAYAKKFETGDWFKLVITALDKNGDVTGEKVEYYLADLRTVSSPGILTEWAMVDLTPLGNHVNTVTFSLESSDNGNFGMNTPAYFCFDNLALKK